MHEWSPWSLHAEQIVSDVSSKAQNLMQISDIFLLFVLVLSLLVLSLLYISFLGKSYFFPANFLIFTKCIGHLSSILSCDHPFFVHLWVWREGLLLSLYQLWDAGTTTTEIMALFIYFTELSRCTNIQKSTVASVIFGQ